MIHFLRDLFILRLSFSGFFKGFFDKVFSFRWSALRRGIILEPFFLIYNVYSTNFTLKNTQCLKILQKVSFYNIEKSEANYVCSDFLRQRSIFCLHSTRVISLISNIGIFRWKFKADNFFLLKNPSIIDTIVRPIWCIKMQRFFLSRLPRPVFANCLSLPPFSSICI